MARPEGLIREQRVTYDQLQFARALRKDMTPTEQLLWKELRTNRLDGFHFRRQQIIGHFVADFYCHSVGLVVEVDGSIHEEQVESDALRDEYMAGRGLTILRITNAEIRTSLPLVLDVIHTRIRELANQL